MSLPERVVILCEHGETAPHETHIVDREEDGDCDDAHWRNCPGGRVVEVNIEAAATTINEIQQCCDEPVTCPYSLHDASVVVAAWLGIEQ